MWSKSQWFIRLIVIIATIMMGLGLRYFAGDLPRWVNLYVGDFLWSVMIFFIFTLIFRKKSTFKIMVLSLIYCYLIEISQIYQAPWINNIRQTTVGHLMLGRGFLWSDLVSYTIGIMAGGALDFSCFGKYFPDSTAGLRN